jgi:chemotaxis protein methyltransferase WspC
MPPNSDKKDALELAQAMLGKTIGMDPDSVGPSLLERVLSERQRQTKSPSWTAYQNLLLNDAQEFDALVERIVVPETWFFRDAAPFDLLKELGAAAARTGAAFYSALSAPCSTGEEPYSMAMTLLEAGLDPNKFRIDAADISHSSLKLAQRGIFGKNSFRGQAPFEIEGYFKKTDEGKAIRAEVQRQVRFFQTNLVAPDAFPGDQAYDVIFCRNFLIYLKPDFKTAIIKRLWDLLKPEGVLFVGHAESLPLLYGQFHSINRPRAFAFLKSKDNREYLPGPAPRPGALTPDPALSPSAPPPRCSRPARVSIRQAPATRQREDSPPLREASANSARIKEILPDIKEDDLQQARRLADEGRLDEAKRLCEQRLEQGRPEAEVYHLLGLVEEAAQRLCAAEAHFKKALYLEPGREETLVHLALLFEQSGKTKQATALRQRLGRLKERVAVESGE